MKIFFLLIFSSCTSLLINENNHLRYKNENLKISLPSNSWEMLTPDKSDYAMINKKTKSIIMINSLCKKYLSHNFNDLFNGMTAGISNLKVKSKKIIKFSGRKASEFEIMGDVDGVKTHVKGLTLKKNRCIYDFILMAKSVIKKNDLKDFNTLLQDFKYND